MAAEETGRTVRPGAVLAVTAGLAAASCPLFLAAGALYLWSGLVFEALLVFPAAEDWRTGYISDAWSLVLFAGGAAHWLLLGRAEDLATAAGIFILFFALARLRAAGEGDAYLAGAAALWLSWEEAAVFLWGAFVLGGLAGAVLVAAGGKRLSEGVPFAPCVAAAGGIAYGAGDALFAAWLAL